MTSINLAVNLTGDTLSIERPLIELFHDHASAMLLTILMQRQAQCSAPDGFWMLDLTGIIQSTGMSGKESRKAIKECAKYMEIQRRGTDYARIDIRRVKEDVRAALINEFKNRKPHDETEEE